MKILVCMKQTFGMEEKIVVKNGKVSDEGVEFVMNPYDEFAVEEAIKLKEEHGGEVTVISIGPDRTESALRTALAMGADRAILINDESLFGDELVLSKVLAQAIKGQDFDIILGGNFAVDSGSGQVAIRLAEELDITHIGSITEVKVEGDKVTVHRDAEGDIEVIEAALPVLLTAQQGLNDPRYPSLPGIMKAKKKPLEFLDAAAIGWEGIQSPTKLIEEQLPPAKGAGRVLEGSLEEQAQQLVGLLQSEHKLL